MGPDLSSSFRFLAAGFLAAVPWRTRKGGEMKRKNELSVKAPVPAWDVVFAAEPGRVER